MVQSHIHVKSKVTLHDQSSKGTAVNGEILRKQSKELGGRDEYVIKLGKATRQLKYGPMSVAIGVPLTVMV